MAQRWRDRNENDLTEKLAEGHRKYGDGNFTVQNIGDETNPNWTVVKCEKGMRQAFAKEKIY